MNSISNKLENVNGLTFQHPYLFVLESNCISKWIRNQLVVRSQLVNTSTHGQLICWNEHLVASTEHHIFLLEMNHLEIIHHISILSPIKFFEIHPTHLSCFTGLEYVIVQWDAIKKKSIFPRLSRTMVLFTCMYME